jgi:hypothetical protein
MTRSPTRASGTPAPTAAKRVLAGSAPPGGGRLGVLVGAVGALAHPDVGVVHAAGADLDQRLASGRPGHRHVVAVDQLVEAAVTGQQHGLHGLWNHGAALLYGS